MNFPINLLQDVLLPLEELNRIPELFEFFRVLGFVIIGLINAVLMVALSLKGFQAIQQCGYKSGAYIKWLKRKDNVYLSRLSMLSILSVLGFLLINMALSFIDHVLIKYAGFLVYFLFLAIYFTGEKKKSKVPLVFTKRMIRLIVTFILLTVISSVLLIWLVNFIAIPFKFNLLAKFRYAILCFCPIAVPYLVVLAYVINEPIEKRINRSYVLKAKENLSKSEELIKIAITGSYGKTSVKQILSSILSEKYNVLATPESYNTPMGIAKTVNRLNENHQVFICEMGAKRVGDILELSNMVEHNIAVITGITYQHLETFGSLENVIKTKSEILKNFNGMAFISSDNKYTVDVYNNATCEKYLAGLNKTDNSFVYAKDVTYYENGSEFTLVCGSESVKVKTVLLGENGVQNIVLASSVALKLNMSLAEISFAISKMGYVPHRLELIKNQNGSYIIDDGYNSNPVGINQAIKALKAFSGKKYVVTPGMVELGHAERGLNFKLGELLSSVCDGVILVGRSGSLQIREGLLSSEYPLDKIFMAKNLEDAKTYLSGLLKEGDVVLFENDLPDIFN